MGCAVCRREAPNRVPIATTPKRVDDESRLASLAYVLWPVALYDRIAPRPDASNWYKFHLRQALWFGTVAALAALVAFLWPLVLSLFVSSVVATIWVYVFAMLLDLALFVFWLVHAIRYSQRAASGELFTISKLSRLTGNPPKKQ